jgi:hypothetical protein
VERKGKEVRFQEEMCFLGVEEWLSQADDAIEQVLAIYIAMVL